MEIEIVNSVSKLLPFEANEGINHESGPYTSRSIPCNMKGGENYEDFSKNENRKLFDSSRYLILPTF